MQTHGRAGSFVLQALRLSMRTHGRAGSPVFLALRRSMLAQRRTESPRSEPYHMIKHTSVSKCQNETSTCDPYKRKRFIQVK